MYERFGRYRARLGEFGQAGDAAAIINAIDAGVVGVVSAVEAGQTARLQAKKSAEVAIAQISGQTAQTEIRAEAEVAESHDAVQSTSIKYSGSTKIILALGLSLTAMILVSGIAVKVAQPGVRQRRKNRRK